MALYRRYLDARQRRPQSSQRPDAARGTGTLYEHHALPASVDKYSIPQGDHAGRIVASFTGYYDRAADETYLPVSLPDGTACG